MPRLSAVGITVLQGGEDVNESFHHIVGQVIQSTHAVASSAEQLSTATTQVAISSQQQTDAAATMAATIEEMTINIDHISEQTRESHQISLESVGVSESGGKIIRQLLDDINRVANSVRQSAKVIEQVGQQSTDISAIISVIKGIADQTSLLALNAAIEAARAGEQGRGFTVVADEVRSLAERTAKSTEEIGAMIVRMQQGTNEAVSTMEREVEEVNRQSGLANQVQSTIDRIDHGTRQVDRSVQEINNALQEQSTASSQIAKNIEQIAQMTEENNAAVQETSETAQHLRLNCVPWLNAFRCRLLIEE